MKYILLLLVAPVMMMAAEQTATFKVSGNCNSCKKTMTKAVMTLDGIASFDWNKDSKMAAVKFDDEQVTLSDIKERILKAGYDVESTKAPDEAYNKLHSCCRYRGKE